MFSDIYSNLSTARRKGGAAAGGGVTKTFFAVIWLDLSVVWLSSFDLFVDGMFTDISNFQFI